MLLGGAKSYLHINLLLDSKATSNIGKDFQEFSQLNWLYILVLGLAPSAGGSTMETSSATNRACAGDPEQRQLVGMTTLLQGTSSICSNSSSSGGGSSSSGSTGSSGSNSSRSRSLVSFGRKYGYESDSWGIR